MTGIGSRPVLVIEQDLPLRGDGLLGRVFRERGLAKRTLLGWEEGIDGTDPASFAGIVALGGTQHAWQDGDPFLAGERRLLLDAHERGVPVLGICLGAQLLARALGAEVGPASVLERGVYDVELLPASADDPVLGRAVGRPPRVYQWHLDSFGLPAGATLLARSPGVPVQAFRLGSSWGVQFHPEVDDELLTSWLGNFPQACAEAGVDEPALRGEFAARERAPFESFAASVIDGFADVVSRRTSPGAGARPAPRTAAGSGRARARPRA